MNRLTEQVFTDQRFFFLLWNGDYPSD